MTRLAFCGLGLMGAPMARRLIDAGHDVTVWNRTPQKAEPLVAAGAKRADTPAEAASEAEAALTMLADPDAVRGVVLGKDGLASGLPDDAALIEMSTVGPAAVRELREALPERVDMMDAPVLGTVPQAEEGSLQVFVGAEQVQFARWAPILEVMGEPRHLGALGAGASMKLVANSALGALQATLGEALALADALDVDEEAALEVLARSPLGATVRSKRDKVMSGSYPPNFKLTLAEKDLRLVSETAEGAGATLRLAPAAREWFRVATEAGLGELDYSAVIAHIRGREARG